MSKRIGLPKGQSIEAMVDVFNTMNINSVTAQRNVAGVATYLQPTTIIAPRVARLSLRYKF